VEDVIISQNALSHFGDTFLGNLGGFVFDFTNQSSLPFFLLSSSSSSLFLPFFHSRLILLFHTDFILIDISCFK
jgi:hypothetical protein